MNLSARRLAGLAAVKATLVHCNNTILTSASVKILRNMEVRMRLHGAMNWSIDGTAMPSLVLCPTPDYIYVPEIYTSANFHFDPFSGGGGLLPDR